MNFQLWNISHRTLLGALLLSIALALLISLACTKKVTQSLGGSLQVDMTEWNPIVPFGGPGASEIFSVSVSGGEILPIAVSSTQPWLGFDVSASETPLEVNIRTVLIGGDFTGDTLATGFYEDTLTINVPGALGSPERIPVTLTVLPQARIKPNHINFVSSAGSANPSSQYLSLTSSGGGNPTYSVAVDASWLHVSPISGTLADTLEVSIDNSSLGSGTFVGEISVTTTGTFTTSQTVPCTLVVASWLPQRTPLKQDVRSIDFVDANNGCAVGVLISIQGTPPVVVSEGYSLVTSDGGLNWNLALPLLPAPLGSIDFSDGFTGWAVGGDGLVVKTTDGGLSWSTIDLGITSDLYDVFFVSPDTGWIVGDSGVTLRTTNAGVDWASPALRTTFKLLSSVHFVDGSYGWAVGDVGTLLSTDDGGQSWNSETPPVGHDLRGVHMQSRTVAWAVGKFGAILKFDGIGWTQTPAVTTDELRDVYFATDAIGWAVGFHGIVLYTSNGGLSWIQQPIVVDQNSLFFCMKFLDQVNGWIGGTDGLIFQTANGGN